MYVLKNLRKFHNNVKKMYLSKAVKMLSSDFKNISVLDLATGKGGDLPKWKSIPEIKYVSGYDIDTDSITEARRRLPTFNLKIPVSFHVKDLGKEILNCKRKYELITSNFAFHYFFKSKSTLDTILSTINNCSKDGSILLLTLFDGTLVKNITEENYIIKMIDKDKKSQYNKKVEVYIKDSVLDKPTIEYLVDPVFLVKKLKTIGFKLVESVNFKDIYIERDNLTNSEKQLSFMNTVYIFKKL